MASSSPTLRPATISDSGAILSLLNGFRAGSPQIAEKAFRNLINCPFQAPGTPNGYVLDSDGRIVGFLATLFSERIIRGEHRSFCNISSWIVAPEFRKHSILLLKPVLELKNHTVTCLTPSPHVYQILRRFGFSDLEVSTTELFPKILKPFPSFGSLLGSNSVSCYDLASLVEPPDFKDLVRDHATLGISFLCFGDGTEVCLIAYLSTKSYRLNFASILYVSNPDFFHRHIHTIRYHLWRVNRTLRMSAPTRLLGGHQFPHSLVRPARTPSLFKCEIMKPGEIDHLYSELAILQDH